MKKLFVSAFVFFILSQTVLAAVTPLKDIEGNVYQTAIEYLFNDGIVSGYPDMTFKPGSSINRAELTKIILESSFDSTLFVEYADDSCFPDVNPEQWFNKYVCFAKAKNIIEGYPDGYFRPENTVNLNEALKIIYEGFSLPVDDENAIFKFKYYSPAARADYLPDALIGKYDKLLNRGEVSEVLYRIITDEDKVIEADVNLNLKVFRQKYQASCGIASLASALSQKNDLTEDQIIERMTALNMYPANPIRVVDGTTYWDDPQKVFVGDKNGLVSIYTNKLTGYGFLETPMEVLAKQWAPNSVKFTNSNLKFISDQLDLGYPVIVFATVNARNGSVIINEPGPFTINWSLDDGRTLTLPMYKHNMVVEGYRGIPGHPSVFYMIDPFYGNKIELTASELSALLNGYKFSGVVIKY